MSDERSSAPNFPDAEYTNAEDGETPHLVIDREEWVPGEHPDPHLREPGQREYLESFYRCIRCGAEAMRKRDLPETCDGGGTAEGEASTGAVSDGGN